MCGGLPRFLLSRQKVGPIEVAPGPKLHVDQGTANTTNASVYKRMRFLSMSEGGTRTAGTAPEQGTDPVE